MEATRRELNGATERARDAAVDIKSNLQDAGKQAMDTAKKVVHDLTESSKETLKTYADEGKKQLETVEEYVREYPVRSILISAAAGMLLSKLFKR